MPVDVAPPDVLTRVQVRTDRFSSEGAGSRLCYRMAAGESPAEALAKLAALSKSAETDAWSQQLPPFAETEPQRTAAFLLAPLELLRVPLPDAHSARPMQLAKLQRKRAFLRFGVAAALVLAALVVGSSLMRRGLSAADEARAILDEARAGDEADHTGVKSHHHGRMGVILLVLAVALAFLAGALLIVAKPLWF